MTALHSFFRAYWPHRDTYSGRAMLRSIIAALRAER